MVDDLTRDRRWRVGLGSDKAYDAQDFGKTVRALQAPPHVTEIMLPGSIGQWANAFTDLEQFAGGAWTVAYNQVQQRANFGIYNGGDTPEEDARVSTAWLKAFGTGAVAVSGPNSHEVWKARFAHPTKFAGRLPALWSEDDVTIYRVPLRSQSLAHVTPVAALVRHASRSVRATREVEKYVAALEDESLPKAEFQCKGQIGFTYALRHGRARRSRSR